MRSCPFCSTVLGSPEPTHSGPCGLPCVSNAARCLLAGSRGPWSSVDYHGYNCLRCAEQKKTKNKDEVDKTT